MSHRSDQIRSPSSSNRRAPPDSPRSKGASDAPSALLSPFGNPAVRLLEVELASTPNVGPTVRTARDVAGILYDLVGRADREHFVALYLNARHVVSYGHIVSRGATMSAPVHPREVFKGAILANSTALIIGHNHPSGDVSPSSDDVRLVERIRQAGELLGIELLDSVVVGPNRRFHSAAERGVGEIDTSTTSGSHEVVYQRSALSKAVCPRCSEPDVEFCFSVWVPLNDFDNRERWNLDTDARSHEGPSKAWCPNCAEHVLVQECS